jgi:hypothetical protein
VPLKVAIYLGPLFVIVSFDDVDGVLQDVFFVIYTDDIKIYYPVRTNTEQIVNLGVLLESNLTFVAHYN